MSMKLWAGGISGGSALSTYLSMVSGCSWSKDGQSFRGKCNCTRFWSKNCSVEVAFSAFPDVLLSDCWRFDKFLKVSTMRSAARVICSHFSLFRDKFFENVR